MLNTLLFYIRQYLVLWQYYFAHLNFCTICYSGWIDCIENMYIKNNSTHNYATENVLFLIHQHNYVLILESSIINRYAEITGSLWYKVCLELIWTCLSISQTMHSSQRCHKHFYNITQTLYSLDFFRLQILNKCVLLYFLK